MLLSHSSVLIVSDDTEFARTVAARWQAERRVPEITLTTSDVWQSSAAEGYNLVIVGPVRDNKISANPLRAERDTNRRNRLRLH